MHAYAVMLPKTTSTNYLPFIFLFILLFIAFSHHLYHDARSAAITATHFLSSSLPPTSPPPPQLPSGPPSHPVYVLIPDWEVLAIVSPESMSSGLIDPNNSGTHACVFRNDAITPAIFSGKLPFSDSIAFKCEFPSGFRRRLPFLQPILTRSPPPPELKEDAAAISQELLRWNFLAYESFTTEEDVVLFVKGVNNRQGVNRPPTEFHCVFFRGGGDEEDAAATTTRTAATTSIQEVFRCPLPGYQGPTTSTNWKVSLEINSDEIGAIRVPTVARYTERLTVDFKLERKSLTCACTMVYNAAKFLKEWVMYHSKIGVERFILYDNGSDDDLRRVVEELVGEGYDVRSLLWIWPKAQEAGFSHCSLFARKICTWMVYIDVDEFIFSPSWLDSASPSPDMLSSLLPRESAVGQVSIRCNEFGPSGQADHPIQGVTQGYTCRRRMEQRHKSIVLIEAIDWSLMNAVHHFKVKGGYRTMAVGMHRAVVNHYKYQAWPEFKAKFRRRVSTYVVDWRQNLNLLSKDRTPGLGSEAMEPVGWAKMFCEVRDQRLQRLARGWFGVETINGTIMAWQR